MDRTLWLLQRDDVVNRRVIFWVHVIVLALVIAVVIVAILISEGVTFGTLQYHCSFTSMRTIFGCYY